MSKHSTGTPVRTSGPSAQTRHQRRRPRGEVYRQPPRVRAQSQHAVEALDPARSGAWDEPGMAPAVEEEPLAAATVAAEPPEAERAVPADAPTLADPTAAGSSQSQWRLPRRTRTLADVVQPRRDPALSGGALSAPSLPSIPSIPSMPVAVPPSDPAASVPHPATPPPAATGTNVSEVEPARTEIIPANGQTSDKTGYETDDAPGDTPGDVRDGEQDGGPRTVPLPVASAPGDDSGETATPLRRSVATFPVPRPARGSVSVETAPIAAVAGGPPASRSGPRVRVGDPWGTSPNAFKDDVEVPSRFLRGARQGVLALAMRVALGHAVAAVVLAVVASALVLLARPLGLWLLVLAGLAAVGGGLAYLLLWWRRSPRIGLLVLALTQMGALAWGCTLMGPRAALLVLAAPAVALALRAGGRWPALLAGTGLVAVYAVFQLAPTWGLSPAIAPPVPVLTVVDTLAVALGMGLLLVELLVAGMARERDLAAARARLYEVRLLRGQAGALRAEVENNGRALDEALAQAMRGRGVDPVALDGPLSLVAERVNGAAERLRVLQRDRAERLRLEGATRTLARALERGWLGLPWVWPELSGTLLDEVIALLRTPRPADTLNTLSDRHENQASEPSAPAWP